ncbi:MAG: hypothetical protein ACO1Q7_18795 [Gemmatimonas sp.]
MGAAQTSAPPSTATPADSALAALVAIASVQNRMPADLMSYSANVETEVALALRREEGTETVVALEQIAGTARWMRTGTLEQHLQGHRVQQLAPTISALTWLNEAWLLPSLYGNRLRTRIAPPPDSTQRRGGRGMQRISASRRDTVQIVHPLATDRDRYYRYSRGDTLVTLSSGERRIPIVRVHVEPRAELRDTALLFVGDMDLDASRGTLVRLRGHFVRMQNTPSRRFGFKLADAIAYVEYENAEREQKYWLPSVQRIELQLSMPVLGEGRYIMRIVTRFPSMVVNDTVIDSASIARADSARAQLRRKLTYASSDSLAKYSAWNYQMGVITQGMHSDDFDDIAPDRLRATGRPRFDIAAPRAADVIHYNRVEGLYTGLGVKLSLRDMAPGVIARANAGYAWSEQSVRGRASVDRTRGNTTLSLRAGRSLDITNDFRNMLDSGATIGALGSVDPYDYVDRYSAGAGVAHHMPLRNTTLRFDVATVNDGYTRTRLRRGIIGDSIFKPNRGVDEGSYLRTTAMVEWHPNVNAEAALPGLSARLYVENANGTLDYTRVEFRAMTRKMFGPFTWTMRGDVGDVSGSKIPPQQLFELGRGQNLPGYENKEFAGSRAAILRTGIMYTSPLLRQPIRLGRRLFIPPIAPGLSMGVQSGWTEAPTDAARESILRLGLLPDTAGVLQPVSRVTNGVRATASVGLRFLAGSLFAGWARPVDRKAPWRFIISMNRTL